MKKYHIAYTEGRTPFFTPMAEKKTIRAIKKIQHLRAKLMGLENINFLQFRKARK